MASMSHRHLAKDLGFVCVFFLVGLGFELGLYACQAGAALLLEPHLQPLILIFNTSENLCCGLKRQN
jgi:hypothetical protein